MVGTYALSEGYADQYYNQALKARRLIKGDYDADANIFSAQVNYHF